MRTAQLGDRVRVHYAKRLQDGAVASSRGQAPLELTVGIGHPRLPGLGLALVGLAEGQSTTLRIPPEQAYGVRDPGRVRDLDRKRFAPEQALVIGKWTRVRSRRGERLVRILEVRDKVVVVDGNHRGAGQTLELKVKLLTFQDAADGSKVPASEGSSPGVSRPVE
jgi:peptidylprolyl isomerase